MRRIISAILSVIVLISGYSFEIFAETDGENLLENSSFEAELLGKDNWKFSNKGGWYNETDVTAERSSEHKNSGEYSVKLSKATVGQRVSLSAGKSYRLTAFVRSDAQTSSPYMGFFDGATDWPSSNSVKQMSINANTSWQEVTLEFECTAAKDYVICIATWDDTNTVYFDDVTLCSYEPEYNGNGIINGNFDNGSENWTITNTANMTVSDGALKASGTNYESRISQTVTDIENGVYDLTAYITSTDISGICHLYAKTSGHTMVSTAIPKTSAAQRVIVPGIIVEDGKCDIGLYVKGSATVTLDNVSLSVSETTRVPFLKGGEISKLTYIEDKGGKFYRADGREGDALQIMAENGFNLARIRILNDPGKGHGDGEYYLPEGYQNEEDCLRLARRAKDKGMHIEWTFAYSDYWVDASHQMVPHEWQEYISNNNLTGEELVKYLEVKVYEYTKDIMQKLIAQDTSPEYVSIGNEIQMGILFNKSGNNNGIYNNSTYLASLTNAGAKAVRETAPDAKIILHSDNGGMLNNRKTFVSILDKVDYDVIGVSYYPFWSQKISIDDVVNEFAAFISKYDKDVIIMETGYNWNEYKPGGPWDGQLADSGYYQDIYGETQDGQRAFLTELYAKLKQVSGGRCIGDLYWDPVMIYDGGAEDEQHKIGWAMDEASDSTQDNVIPNSTIFDFDGKEVAGQQAMKYNTNSTDNINISGKVSKAGVAAANTKITFAVNGRKYSVSTDKFGDYIISVPYPADGKFEISAAGYAGNYTVDAPYNGVFLGNVDFADASGSISKIEGYFDTNGKLHFEADYVTEIEEPVFYAAVYKDGILKGCTADKSGIITSAEGNGAYTLKAFLWYNSMEPVCTEFKDIIYSGV